MSNSIKSEKREMLGGKVPTPPPPPTNKEYSIKEGGQRVV
jgi:hypothetical protein